jgi:hypothetical protein
LPCRETVGSGDPRMGKQCKIQENDVTQKYRAFAKLTLHVPMRCTGDTPERAKKAALKSKSFKTLSHAFFKLYNNKSMDHLVTGFVSRSDIMIKSEVVIKDNDETCCKQKTIEMDC